MFNQAISFNRAISQFYISQCFYVHVISTGTRLCLLLVVLFGGVYGAVSVSAQEQPAVVPAPATTSEVKERIAPAPTDVAQPTHEQYRIGAGDVLDVRVLNRPQLSRETVRVDDRGTIQMPWIDKEIQAACRTERELAEELTALYRRYLRSPQVDVFIKEYQSAPVSVIGAVNTPGRFQLQRRLRLLDLLTYVNGPAERAGRTIQIIHASDSRGCTSPTEDQFDNTEVADAKAADATVIDTKIDNTNLDDANASDEEDVTILALGKVLRGEADANPYVRAGDVVTVLEAEQVFVIGNVIKPTQIPLRDSLTVSQAVARAGGLAPDAKSDKIRVVRQSPDSKKSIFFVDLKAIDKGQATDVALQANDIVDIPSSNTRGKQIGKAILSSFFPAVGTLPVRVIQ